MLSFFLFLKEQIKDIIIILALIMTAVMLGDGCHSCEMRHTDTLTSLKVLVRMLFFLFSVALSVISAWTEVVRGEPLGYGQFFEKSLWCTSIYANNKFHM
jgi:hypothetical protein